MCLLLLPLLVLSPLVQANIPPQVTRLLVKQQLLNMQLTHNDFGVPIVIESNGDNDRTAGNVYGILQQPFSSVRHALARAPNWCKITPLHFNVKACTWQKLNGDYRLTLYSGRKFYEKPETTYVFSYRFHSQCNDASYCEVTLTAKDGPMDTRDYRIQVEFIPLDGNTFVHFHYSYDYGFVTSTAMFGYFATLGAGKEGFSITGWDDTGAPIYVGGMDGVIERNAMRYYLALQAYLDSTEVPAEQRFENRLLRWYKLTEHYHRQLYEMSWKDYLQYKRHEHRDQQKLQQAVNNTASADHMK
jgi:hypothetical protein